MKRRVRWIRVGPSRRRARVAVVEPLAELTKIRIRDNNEPLVELHSYCSSISFQPPEIVSPQVLARRTVAEMLNRAQRRLPKGYRLLVMSAWRSLEEQQEMYHRIYEHLRSEHPEWPENILRREANRFVHPPDHRVPPGHCTGGALDLTIIGPDGQLLDMTSPYAWQRGPCEADAVAATFSSGISETARRNRQLLIEVMSAVGFTNYGGEWWHWSYGDSAWAWRLCRKAALYGLAAPIETYKIWAQANR